MDWVQAGIGHLPRVQLRADKEGKLGDAAVLRLGSSIDAIIGRLNGGLLVGSGEANTAAGNLSAGFLRITFPSTPDTEVMMPHGLKRVPIAAIPVFKDRACDVYSLRGAADAWGDVDKAYFACSVASAKVILLLL